MARAFRILAAVIALIGFGWSQAHAQIPLTGAGRGAPAVAAGCSQATAFLARSTLTGSDATNYTTFICAGVTHGWWAKMDAVYVWAAPDSTNALLNLVQNAFNATLNGAPGFVAHSGFIGVDASSTVFIDTGFNPTTATTPNFVQDSAHISVCSLTNAASGVSGGKVIGLENAGGVQGLRLLPKYNDGNLYGDVNTNSDDPGIANADSTGQYVINRSGPTAVQKYRNAVSIGTTAAISLAVLNGNVFVLASNTLGTGAVFGGAYRTAITTFGSSLSSTDVTNLHNDSNALMTAFGTGGC